MRRLAEQHDPLMGEALGKPPAIFHVNWFRQGDDGRFLWPGFGQNLRVLLWMIDRIEGRAGGAEETPIGFVPRPQDLNLDGLELPKATIEKLLAVDREEWAAEVPEIRAFFDRFGDRLPPAMSDELESLSQKLGRAPNATELSTHLRLPRQEVLEGLTAANAYHSSSLDEADFGDDDSPSLLNTLGENDPALANVEYRESLQPLLAALPERERTIVILRFFANLTQSQIADKVGVSQMHVSRLLSQTLRRLRRELQQPD